MSDGFNTPPRTPLAATTPAFAPRGCDPLSTPQKTRPRRTVNYHTPQPSTIGRLQGTVAPNLGYRSPQPRCCNRRPRNETDADVEILRQRLAREETLAFAGMSDEDEEDFQQDPDAPSIVRPQARRTPGRSHRTETPPFSALASLGSASTHYYGSRETPTGAADLSHRGTPAAGPPQSPLRSSTVVGADDLFAAALHHEHSDILIRPASGERSSTTIKTRVRHHRQASSSSLECGGVAAFAATPIPNRNPFTSPARSFTTGNNGHETHVPGHRAIVAYERTAQPPAMQRASSGLHSASATHFGTPAPHGRPGYVIPRYRFRHVLPWLPADAQNPEGEYVPLTQDANGTEWLGTAMLDGVSYAVKEVPFSDAVAHLEGSSLEVQRAIARDPAVHVEVAALGLSRTCRYIKRYFSVHHDALLRIHVIRTEYCARGTLHDDALAHASSPAHCGPTANPTPAFGGMPESMVWDALKQVYQGLLAAHRHGIAHNALHPRCVAVNDNGEFKLSAFGSATFYRAGEAFDPTTIAPALPSLYEPPAIGKEDSGETPFTRDVYSFAAGLLHLVAMSEWQARHQRPVDLDDPVCAVLPTPRDLVDHLGFSQRLVDTFDLLLDPNPAARLTSAAVVRHLRPPAPTVAALLDVCDMEAARLRAKLHRLQQGGAATTTPQASCVPPPFADVAEPAGPSAGPLATAPSAGDLDSQPACTLIASSCGPGSANRTLASSLRDAQPNAASPRRVQSRRPTTLTLPGNLIDRGDSCSSPVLTRDAILTPGPSYAIRMHRRHSFVMQSSVERASLSPLTQPSQCPFARSGDSPVPVTNDSVFRAFSASVPRGLCGMNSFDDACAAEEMRSPPMATRSGLAPLAPPPEPSLNLRPRSEGAGSPPSRTETSTDLFGAREDTPQFDSIPLHLNGPAHNVQPPAAAQPRLRPWTRTPTMNSALDEETAHAVASFPQLSEFDVIHNAHAASADEMLRLLQQRMPHLTRPSAPLQDTPTTVPRRRSAPPTTSD